MTGCGRLDQFSVITYHLAWFSHHSPWQPQLKGWENWKRCVQWVKYRQELMCHLCAHMQCHTRPAGRLDGLGRFRHRCRSCIFFQCSKHKKYTSKKRYQSSCLSLQHSSKAASVTPSTFFAAILCSTAYLYCHKWPIITSHPDTDTLLFSSSLVFIFSLTQWTWCCCLVVEQDKTNSNFH